MKNIIKKIAAISLSFSLASTIHAYAGVLDIITDSGTIKENESTIETKINDTTNQTTIENTIKAVTFSDISTSWAKDIIENAVQAGLVSGYEDGTFRPDIQITRAEFAKLLNNAMEIESTSDLSFTDVKADDWFYGEIQKAISVGFFNGYQDNTFMPGNSITRQEAAKVVASSITTGNIEGDGATLLVDYSTIQEWAKPGVNTAYNKGYIIGYPGSIYNPTRALTRAEAVKIIYEIINNENIEKGFNITNYNESYSGTVVVGNLNILDSVGSGNAYISNVTVLGDIVISAKDIKSIVLTDVKARNIIVEDDSNPVKIVCNDNINILNAELPSVAVIERLGHNINI